MFNSLIRYLVKDSRMLIPLLMMLLTDIPPDQTE